LQTTIFEAKLDQL